MIGPPQTALGAVLRAARARLWAENLAASLSRCAWLTAAVLGAGAFFHLLLRPLPRSLVPMALAAGLVLALAETLRRAPTQADCARWADAELEGRATFTASLAIGSGRLRGSAAAVSWLAQGLRETAVRSLARLAMRRLEWPLAALATAAISALAAALVLSLPGGGALAAWREVSGATSASHPRPASPDQRGAPALPEAAGNALQVDADGQARLRAAASPDTVGSSGDAGERAAPSPRAGVASASAAGGRDAGAGKGSLDPAEALVRAVELNARRRDLRIRDGAGAGRDAPGDSAYVEGERAPALAGSLRAAPSVPPPRVAPDTGGPLESLLTQRYANSRAGAP